VSLEITAKSLALLNVNGVHFSSHVQEREAIEKASKVLELDPAIVCTMTPPIVEIKASKSSVAVPVLPVEPVTTDGGEDLFDFLERIGPEPRIEVTVTAPTLMAGLEQFLDSTRTSWLIQKFYVLAADGTKTLVAYGWRGFGFVVHRRVKGTIKLGGTS
jgi:hypothetical protein